MQAARCQLLTRYLCEVTAAAGSSETGERTGPESRWLRAPLSERDRSVGQVRSTHSSPRRWCWKFEDVRMLRRIPSTAVCASMSRPDSDRSHRSHPLAAGTSSHGAERVTWVSSHGKLSARGARTEPSPVPMADQIRISMMIGSGIYRKFVLTVKQTHRLTDDQIGECVGSKSHRTRKVNVSAFAVCEEHSLTD